MASRVTRNAVEAAVAKADIVSQVAVEAAIAKMVVITELAIDVAILVPTVTITAASGACSGIVRLTWEDNPNS